MLRRADLPHDLVFVGERARGYETLLMDEMGRVFAFAATAENALSLVGRSGDELIENAAAGHVGVRLDTSPEPALRVLSMGDTAWGAASTAASRAVPISAG